METSIKREPPPPFFLKKGKFVLNVRSRSNSRSISSSFGNLTNFPFLFFIVLSTREFQVGCRFDVSSTRVIKLWCYYCSGIIHIALNWYGSKCKAIKVNACPEYLHAHVDTSGNLLVGMGIAKNFVSRYITIFILNIVIISRYYRTLHFFLFFSNFQYSLSVLPHRCQIWFILNIY